MRYHTPVCFFFDTGWPTNELGALSCVLRRLRCTSDPNVSQTLVSVSSLATYIYVAYLLFTTVALAVGGVVVVIQNVRAN